MIHIENKEQFDKEIAQGNVIIDFYANWCSPCKMLSPVLEKIEEENPDLKILKINVDDQLELASLYRVSSIPLLVFYKDGKKIGDRMGYVPKPQLEEILKEIY